MVLLPSFLVSSSFNPVVASIRIKLKKTRKKHEKCLKLDLLFLKNRDIQEKYEIAVKNRFDILGHLEYFLNNRLRFKKIEDLKNYSTT